MTTPTKNDDINKEELLPAVIKISEAAGDAILEVYNREGEINIEAKSDDSPLTEADLASNQVIVDGLTALTPDIPVLSEEGGESDYNVRKQWSKYWLIDPLDGTKEFINRNDEFTVNIALIENGEPTMGVVSVPVTAVTYSGIKDIGAWKTEGAGNDVQRKEIKSRPVGSEQVVVVASRRHRGEKLEACINAIAEKIAPVETTSMGSSLKICLVAEGAADIYPRLAPTCEWDTAASQAVLEAAGGILVDDKFWALRYNQKEELLNPYFYAIGDSAVDWKGILENI